MIEDMDQATFRRAFCAEPFPAKKQGRKVTKADRSKLEDAFLAAWRVVGAGLPEPESQFRFHPSRKWRFDYCWKDSMLAVELQGGGFVQGAHGRGAQQTKDFEKLNAAIREGYFVLQYGTSAMQNPFQVAAEVAEVLRARIQAEER